MKVEDDFIDLGDGWKIKVNLSFNSLAWHPCSSKWILGKQQA